MRLLRLCCTSALQHCVLCWSGWRALLAPPHPLRVQLAPLRTARCAAWRHVTPVMSLASGVRPSDCSQLPHWPASMPSVPALRRRRRHAGSRPSQGRCYWSVEGDQQNIGPSWANVRAILAVLEAILGHPGAVRGRKTLCNQLWASLPGGRRAGPELQGEFFWKRTKTKTGRI